MTIVATHFAVVLGAWRLRVRIDLDEPRESELRAQDAPPGPPPAAQQPTPVQYPRYAPWGRG